jgi:hypothetical protein
MKKILIIAPHFPPSNLTGVHRARLFANHLAEFGWQPLILMVHEKYYEERPDNELVKLLPPGLQIEKVGAFPITRPRIFGDLGLRSFFQLYRRARTIIRSEKIDFLYIPIPSFYTALLGRWLHRTTGIKYGIDYIDPWVHDFPGSQAFFSRARFSTAIAKMLEPIAVKKASLITGVAEGYYKGVLERNPGLALTCKTGAMPYGGERSDHEKIGLVARKPYVFEKMPGKMVLVYAGTLLPKAFEPLEAIVQGIVATLDAFQDLQIHFIGSGKTPDDPEGYKVRPLAEKYGLWNTVIFEHPSRIPYLDTLIHLDAADGIFILGSTEPHYSPSKVYQGVLAGKPILAVLHKASPVVDILRSSGAGIVLDFDGEKPEEIRDRWLSFFQEYRLFSKDFKTGKRNDAVFEPFSASAVTRHLAQLLDEIV